MCSEYHRRIYDLEDAKFDLEYSVAKKDLEARVYFFTLFGVSMY